MFFSEIKKKLFIPGNKGFKFGLINKEAAAGAAFFRELLARVAIPVLCPVVVPAVVVVVELPDSFRLVCLAGVAVVVVAGVATTAVPVKR